MLHEEDSDIADERDTLLNENWKLKVKLSELELEREANVEWAVKDAEARGSFPKKEEDLCSSIPRVKADVGLHAGETEPVMQVKETKEYQDLLKTLLEVEGVSAARLQRLEEMEKRFELRKQMQRESDRNARIEISKVNEQVEKAQDEKKAALKKTADLECQLIHQQRLCGGCHESAQLQFTKLNRQLRNANTAKLALEDRIAAILKRQAQNSAQSKQQLEALNSAHSVLVSKLSASSSELVWEQRGNATLKEDFSALKLEHDALQLAVEDLRMARYHDGIKEAQRLRPWDLDDYSAFITKNLPENKPSGGRLHPLCDDSRFTDLLSLLRPERQMGAQLLCLAGGQSRVLWCNYGHGVVLTPRFCYEPENNLWTLRKEFDSRFNRTAEVCYSDQQKFCWVGRYRCIDMQAHNPIGYGGEEIRNAAWSLTELTILPHKPRTPELAARYVALKAQIQQMYYDGVLPVDCMILEEVIAAPEVVV
ncbi:hypothetical protein BKA70DRAFT_1565398 [Coprinopsis sp. MPI-PUGE-AT-0042]|nr:hypothetical protein BKA70DRAFT_1565398 [Coprinopsis sp. MPI-PUGE-AT-0042]